MLQFKTRLRISEMLYLIYAVLVSSLMLLNAISDYRVSMYLLAITFIWIVILTLKHRNLSLYQLFLFTYFFFLLSRVFLTIFGYSDFRLCEYMQVNYMSPELALRTLNVLTVFLIGTSYAWLFYCGDKRCEERYFKRKVITPYFDHAYNMAFYIFFFMCLIKYIYIIRYVQSHGYLSMFNGANLNFPVILTGATTLFEGFFLLMTYYHRDVKSIKFYFSLYILSAIVRMFEGPRAFALVLILYTIYFWSHYYSEIKFTNWKIVLLVLLIPFVITIIGSFRSGNGLKALYEDNIYLELLQRQGVSISVVSNTIRLGKKFTNRIPFLFGYFTDIFLKLPPGQTIEDITQGNYLGHHLSYLLNRNSFLNGGGIGSSIVAEVYDSFGGNLLFVLIAAILITLLVFYVEKIAYKSLFSYVISFTMLRQFIFSPRDSVFKGLNMIIPELFMCFCVVALESTVAKRKRRKEMIQPSDDV